LEEVANIKNVPNWISYLHPNSWIFDPFLDVLINFLNLKTDLNFPNFNTKSVSDLKKFLWRKLFLSSKPSQPYFVSNFSSLRRSFLDRSKFGRI
jgi:hypothetical protein